MSHSKKIRKKYLIHPAFQIRFILLLAFFSLSSVALMYFTSILFFWELSNMATSLGVPLNSSFFQYISREKEILNHVTAITSVCLCLIIFFVGLLFSHRVAGSIHRLDRHLSNIAKGEPLNEIRFRKNDFFPEIAKHFNSMVKRLKERS